MVISKFICIPLLILVPLTILFFESRSRDFTQPPSDQEIAKQVEEWKATKPSLQQSKAFPATPPKVVKKTNIAKLPTVPDSAQAQPTPPKVEDATKGLDLELSPGLNHLQGMKAKRLKLLIQQLDPNLYPELIYLANERLLDSAPDASVDDIHAAGAYLNDNPRPLWNPEPSLRLPLKVQFNVPAHQFEQAKALASKLETSIFWGSGGTVQPTITIKKIVHPAGLLIIISGKNGGISSDFLPLADTEKMLGNAIQIAVTKAIKAKKLPTLHTDQIHYTYFSRLTWHLLAQSL